MLALVHSSERGFAEQTLHLALDQTGRRVADRLCQDLMQARAVTVLPLAMSDSDHLQFQRVTGYKNGAAQLGPVTTYGFELAPGEAKNGKDDNGDHRVDEGFIVQAEAGGTGVPIAGQVLALRFTSAAGGVSFAVDVGLVGRDGQLVQKTFVQRVTFRN
jgi:hypothetical protein